MTTKTVCDCCGDDIETTTGWWLRLSKYDTVISMHRNILYADLCEKCGDNMMDTLEKYLVKLRGKK